VRVGNDIAFGPGKADLLSAIAKTGSLVAAAKQLGMSYMRAWTLLQTMNHCFRPPLVITVRGGRHGGKAELTEDGLRALACTAAWKQGASGHAVGLAQLSKCLR